jgi:hypothetical protein
MNALVRSYHTRRAHKPTIVVAPAVDLQDLVEHAARILAQAPHRVFSRGGRLVRVGMGGGRAWIEELDDGGLAGLLVERVRFVQLTSRGHPRIVEPPRWLVRTLLSAPPPIFPELRGVVHHPIVRPDGSICMQAGYDPETRFWCHLGTLDIPPVPHRPTNDDLTQARDVLDDLCCDFPFVDDASRANAIALLLTPIVRTAFEGPTPLFLLDKPSPGTGATLLARLVALVACGEEAVTSPPEDEAEARKVVTAALLQDQEVVIFDDVPALRLRTLSRLLTAETWETRLLGTNRLSALPNLATWVVTGANITLGADLARRVVWVRLDAKHWRPWEREGFLHPDLLSYVRKERGRILWALLTLVRHYFLRGCSQATVPILGSFENWAYLVGGVLAACGIEGFLQNRERLYEEIDQQHAGWPEFLRALHERHKGPFTTRVLSDKLQSDEELRAAAPESLETFTPRALSEALRRRAGMRFGPDGLRVERVGRGREGVLWQVVVDSPTDLREPATQLFGPEATDDDAEAMERAALREA